LWKVQGSFPNWAQMWDAAVDGSEVGRTVFVTGRGTQRGAPVYGLVGAPRDGGEGRVPVREQKGWLWGTADGVQSWGTNTVDTIFDASSFGLGDLLTFDFDRISPLVDESALSNFDSGGGVFVQSPTSGQWKLAGINFSVDGPWRERATGAQFLASIFDAGGLYNGNDFIPDGSTDVPASSYSSRVSSNLAFIRSIIGPTGTPDVPEPATGTIALLISAAVFCRRQRRA
jgi:hypothetical protein